MSDNPNRPDWTDEEDAYLRQHYPTVSAAAIGDALGRNKAGVRCRAETLRIRAVSRQPSKLKPPPPPKAERHPAILKPCIPARPMAGKGPAHLPGEPVVTSRTKVTIGPSVLSFPFSNTHRVW
jgi:hypothetical protein